MAVPYGPELSRRFFACCPVRNTFVKTFKDEKEEKKKLLAAVDNF